jgi:hypothetical protein
VRNLFVLALIFVLTLTIASAPFLALLALGYYWTTNGT